MSSVLKIGMYCSSYGTLKEAKEVKNLKRRIHNMGYNLLTMSEQDKLDLYNKMKRSI